MGEESSSMEFHDVDDNPSHSSTPAKKPKRFRSLSLKWKKSDESSDKSATLPQKKKKKKSITRFLSFKRKSSKETVNEDVATQSDISFIDVENFSTSLERLHNTLLQSPPVIELRKESKLHAAHVRDDDSTDSFKSAGSPELCNRGAGPAVDIQPDAEYTLTERAFTVFAESDFVKGFVKPEEMSQRKERIRGRGSATRDEPRPESEVAAPTPASPKAVPPAVPTSAPPPAKPASPPAKPASPPAKPAPEAQPKPPSPKEEPAKVSGADLRKQLEEGLKNGAGKAKDVKAQLSEMTQNAVKTSEEATQNFLETEKAENQQQEPVPSTSTVDPEQLGLPPTENKKEHLYKILVIGELGTGKTSIIKRYVHQFFSQHYRATIGVDFALKVLNWDENSIIRLQLWDIAGQERFGNMTRVYYKEAVGAFIVFDVTRAATFDAVQKWKQDLDSKVQLSDGSPIPCVLLANKCDQPKEGLVVNNRNRMEEYCRENGFAEWFETSAKENINIEDAARSLVLKILQNDKLIKTGERGHDNDKIALDGSSETQSNRGCSC